MLLLCALVAGSGSVWADEIYVKVTDVSDLAAGDKLILVGQIETGDYYAMGAMKSTNRDAVEVTPETDGSIVLVDGVTVLTLGGETDAWTFHDGNGYLWASGGTSSNHLKVSANLVSGQTDATISISSGNATIKFNIAGGNKAKNWLRLNQGKSGSTYTPLYSCYNSDSGQRNVSIYKLTKVSGTISASGYNTFSSPYKLDLNTLSGADGAYVASCVTDGKVVLTKSTAKMAASTTDSETGLFIKGTKDATFTIDVTADDATFSGTNLLLAAPSGKTVEAAGSGYNYVFGWETASNPGFYLIGGTSATLVAGKAYLHTTDELATSGSARAGFIFEDENVTGITSVAKQTTNSISYYDLQGRRVAQPTKGLYIVNGKKVIIK